MEKKKVCREFGLANSTIQTFWQNRTRIINAFEQIGLTINAGLVLREFSISL